MSNKLFWTLDKMGNEVLRDLETESKNFNMEDYHKEIYDANNYQWQEMFNHFI